MYLQVLVTDTTYLALLQTQYPQCLSHIFIYLDTSLQFHKVGALIVWSGQTTFPLTTAGADGSNTNVLQNTQQVPGSKTGIDNNIRRFVGKSKTIELVFIAPFGGELFASSPSRSLFSYSLILPIRRMLAHGFAYYIYMRYSFPMQDALRCCTPITSNISHVQLYIPIRPPHFTSRGADSMVRSNYCIPQISTGVPTAVLTTRKKVLAKYLTG